MPQFGPPTETPLEKKLSAPDGVPELRVPAEFRENAVSTVAVDGLLDVMEQAMAPVADTSIVKPAEAPCCTVTSLTVPVSSAVTSSAADARLAVERTTSVANAAIAGA